MNPKRHSPLFATLLVAICALLALCGAYASEGPPAPPPPSGFPEAPAPKPANPSPFVREGESAVLPEPTEQTELEKLDAQMAATELTELEKFELRIAAIERFGDLEKYEALANLDARLTRIESLSSISVLLTRGG